MKRTGEKRNGRKRSRARYGAAVSASVLAKPGRINPRWAWHHGALLRLRDRLRAERGEQLAGVREPIEPHSMDIADSATDEFDRDRARSALSAEQDALYEVEEALSRIRSGTYGTCEETGARIPAARLRAIPWTRYGREVEARLEKKGIVRRPHIAPATSLHDTAAGGLAEAKSPEAEEPEVEPKDEAMAIYYVPGKHLRRERKNPARKSRSRARGRRKRG